MPYRSYSGAVQPSKILFSPARAPYDLWIAGPNLSVKYERENMAVEPNNKEKSRKVRTKKSTLDKTTAKNRQIRLKNLGYDPGPIDGVLGPMFQNALVQFQNAHDLVVDGKWGPKTKTVIKKIENQNKKLDKSPRMIAEDEVIRERKITKSNKNLIHQKQELLSFPFRIIASCKTIGCFATRIKMIEKFLSV